MNFAVVESDGIYSSLGSDPDLGPLVELFVEEMPGRIASLLGHHRRAEWEQVARTAHQLKGAAGSYGFDQITPLAAELEFAIREKLPEETVLDAVEELVRLCRQVRSGTPS